MLVLTETTVVRASCLKAKEQRPNAIKRISIGVNPPLFDLCLPKEDIECDPFSNREVLQGEVLGVFEDQVTCEKRNLSSTSTVKNLEKKGTDVKRRAQVVEVVRRQLVVGDDAQNRRGGQRSSM